MGVYSLIQQRAKLERLKYSEDFLSFLKDVLGYVDIVEGVHGPIVKLLTDRSSRYKMFLLPRGSFKTSIVSIGYPLWRLAYEPDLRILLDSKTLDRAKMILSEIKWHIEYNDRFKEIYGEWKNIPGWQEDAVTIPQRTRPLKEPSIATGGVDSPRTGGHYDIIIADDLHDEKNITTDLMRQRVILHYKTLHPILEPDGELIIVGTRWHTEDVYKYIMDHERCEYL
jgi:hypothetical protein